MNEHSAVVIWEGGGGRGRFCNITVRISRNFLTVYLGIMKSPRSYLHADAVSSCHRTDVRYVKT